MGTGALSDDGWFSTPAAAAVPGLAAGDDGACERGGPSRRQGGKGDATPSAPRYHSGGRGGGNARLNPGLVVVFALELLAGGGGVAANGSGSASAASSSVPRRGIVLEYIVSCFLGTNHLCRAPSCAFQPWSWTRVARRVSCDTLVSQSEAARTCSAARPPRPRPAPLSWRRRRGSSRPPLSPASVSGHLHLHRSTQLCDACRVLSAELAIYNMYVGTM